jgi:hypothetical protein
LLRYLSACEPANSQLQMTFVAEPGGAAPIAELTKVISEVTGH